MKRNDYFLLAAFCLVVFGISLVGGRPLTMHEAVLPECTREMHLSGNWLVPTSGGRPWLHRPPLPHWTLLLLNLPYADIVATWQVRLGPLLAGIITTLTTAWLAQRYFGRSIGLLTGLILATSFQFTRYAWLAEEDMFLCAVVTGALALFAKVEVSGSLPFPRGGSGRGASDPNHDATVAPPPLSPPSSRGDGSGNLPSTKGKAGDARLLPPARPVQSGQGSDLWTVDDPFPGRVLLAQLLDLPAG